MYRVRGKVVGGVVVCVGERGSVGGGGFLFLLTGDGVLCYNHSLKIGFKLRY